jgi:phage gp16-like protein
MIGKLGISDDEYRAILMDKFKKSSSLDLNPAQKTLLINHLRALLNGYKVDSKPVKTTSEKPQVQFICTLWNEMADLGIVRNRNGLRSFVAKMTGVEQVEWLQPKDLQKVTQALKAMKKRG